MANIRLIKGRIKSAKNISQITKAMELVSASKMKKAQGAAQMGKWYAEKIHTMVTTLAASVGTSDHPLLTVPKKPKGKRLLIVISTNKGMCGGLNTSLFRHIAHTVSTDMSYDVMTVGKKGTAVVSLIHGAIVADFSAQTSFPSAVPAMIQYAVGAFLNGEVDGVDVAYNEFVSALTQVPRIKTLLPLSIEATEKKAASSGEMLVEPSPAEVFNALLPHYVENQLRDAVLQAEASEHSARMIAMRNATDNAQSLMKELTLVYNKARQEKITYEISDIVTAQLAVS